MRRLFLGGLLVAAVAATGSSAAEQPLTRWRTLHVDGQALLVGAPAWYSRTNNPPLPLVISPHARGGSAARNARRWGDLPGQRDFIIVAPSLKGRVLDETRTWGYPPAISRLADSPRLARRLLPWLRWDPERVYAAGFSMGGQEALLLLARRPDLLAAVSVADSVTDFVRRWYEFPLSPLTRAEQAKATRELGGTPRRVPWLYRRRSPTTFARTIAFSGVPVQLWWNPREDVVVHQATTQSGAFARVLERLGAPVFPVVHSQPHGEVFRAANSLGEMVQFLLAHRRAGPPARGFSYASWRRRATVWGWTFRSGDVGHGFWRVDGVTSAGFRSSSSTWLVVRPPGGRTVRVAPGRHVVRLRR
jgi:poly(3-hydroxybutyrate) depolymerase